MKSGDKLPEQVGRILSPPVPSEYVVEVAVFRRSVGAAAVSNALETLTVTETRSRNNLTQSTLSSLAASSRKYVQSCEKENCSYKKKRDSNRGTSFEAELLNAVIA